MSFDKSKVMFSKNMGVKARTRICGVANIAAFENSWSYLGFPMHHGRNGKENFQSIIGPRKNWKD